MAKEGLFFGNKIPLATLWGLIGTIVIGTWFVSAIYSRLEAVETRQQNGVSSFERLIRLETQFDAMKDTLIRIDQNVNKIAEQDKK